MPYGSLHSNSDTILCQPQSRSDRCCNRHFSISPQPSLYSAIKFTKSQYIVLSSGTVIIVSLLGLERGTVPILASATACLGGDAIRCEIGCSNCDATSRTEREPQHDERTHSAARSPDNILVDGYYETCQIVWSLCSTAIPLGPTRVKSN